MAVVEREASLVVLLLTAAMATPSVVRALWRNWKHNEDVLPAALLTAEGKLKKVCEKNQR